jgi:hypothetical protein
VIIDRKSLRDSRGWIVLSLLVLLVTSIGYVLYAAHAPTGTSGGSWQGLTFGGVGTAIIVFAWALTVRKWRRSWRWGKTYAWLQGHVYLSLVSYPVILYHAGFHFGGPLTRALMWAFTICYFSGILVLILQQILPRLLLTEVPLETIYEQIDHVSRKNLAAADALVEANATIVAAGPDLGEDDFANTGGAGGVATVRPPTRSRSASGAGSTAAELKDFYDRRVRPFLADGMGPADRATGGTVVAAWARATRRTLLPFGGPEVLTPNDFTEFRRSMPEGLHPVVNALEGYTEERRQFALQRRLQHLLHGWLLVHVPASWVMIVLLPLHAIMALRYG